MGGTCKPLSRRKRDTVRSFTVAQGTPSKVAERVVPDPPESQFPPKEHEQSSPLSAAKCVYCQMLLSKNAAPAELIGQEPAGTIQNGMSAEIEPGVCVRCFEFWRFAVAEFHLPALK